MKSTFFEGRLLVPMAMIGIALLACDREPENPSLVEQPAVQGSEDTRSANQNEPCEQSDCFAENEQITAKVCHYDGVDYQLGEKMPSMDMCEDCECGEHGISCTRLACEEESVPEDKVVEGLSLCERCLAGEDLEICRQIRCAAPK